MRKFTLFFMSLFLAVGAMAQDYSTNYDGQSKNRRSINYVALTSPALGEFKVELTSAENNSLVVDKTDIVFKCNVGETVTPSTGYTSGWMHTYVYVDADNNGFIAEDPSAADLVSFAYYNGRNSLGNTVGDNIVAAPSFTAPTTPGTYRMRYKIDWDNIDPKGSVDANNTMSANAGGIIDVTLQVVELPVYTVTYNYKQNGILIGSISHQAAQGSEFPALVSGLYSVTVNGSKPTDTVQADGEYDIDVTIGEMPFEYYASITDVNAANGWYNLVMHSNQGDGRYRTYVGAGDATKLAWGELHSIINPTDDYFWAFVGNPINGFRVVNKAKGEGYVLSSNGSANPTMLLESDLADGYNTTWAIAARTSNGSNDWVAAGDWFCLKYRNAWYMNANAGDGTVNFWNSDDNGSGILAVKPLVVNAAADVATYFAETAFKVPATFDAEVYYASGINDAGYMQLEGITSETIYPGTGVVVKVEVDEDIVYAPEFVSPGAATAPEGNLLKGTTKKTLITKESSKAYYVLGMTGGVGFYNAVNGKNENEFYNGAFKAYLEMPAQQGTAVFYGFDWAGTTGVENVEVENANVIYDLTGRKVNVVERGIYIINGKKVLVK